MGNRSGRTGTKVVFQSQKHRASAGRLDAAKGKTGDVQRSPVSRHTERKMPYCSRTLHPILGQAMTETALEPGVESDGNSPMPVVSC